LQWLCGCDAIAGAGSRPQPLVCSPSAGGSTMRSGPARGQNIDRPIRRRWSRCYGRQSLCLRWEIARIRRAKACPSATVIERLSGFVETPTPQLDDKTITRYGGQFDGCQRHMSTFPMLPYYTFTSAPPKLRLPGPLADTARRKAPARAPAGVSASPPADRNRSFVVSAFLREGSNLFLWDTLRRGAQPGRTTDWLRLRSLCYRWAIPGLGCD